MRVRRLLTLTAFVSSVLGAVVVYLVLTVPNDLKADALLKGARQDLAAGKTPQAQNSLAQIVQQYPRTDAAAAATVALVKIGAQERARLEQQLENLKSENHRRDRVLTDLQKSVETIKSTPPPKPVVVVQAPPKKAPPKKATPKKRTTTKRRKR